MSDKNLTSNYRPQAFNQVLGQEAVCTILSRAAAKDRMAPAYMFSGTRGVGKTTVARILAKAVNCRQSPTAEPCNKCSICRQITQGTSLDVQEIDGASHTGVDHVRRLNEEVGYFPLECRYKIIIIDEAHMLSKSAFNALLKTLEEPPAHALFVLATTEPHKFPATIVSRCQHFSFKLVPAKDLVRHMGSILQQEAVHWQEQALELLARKASGSVRDALSMLDQVLALGEKELTSDQVRNILGIAGQNSMQDLFRAFAEQDCLAVSNIVSQLLEQGLDLGFFLQELVASWRNLFILKQAGEKGVEFLGLPQEEIMAWQELAAFLPLAQIHAAWQMTLEGQRQVISSADPGLALELLLFNITFLPNLMPLEQISGLGQESGSWAQKVAPLEQREQPSERGQQGQSKEKNNCSDSIACTGPAKYSGQQTQDWAGFMQYLTQSSYHEQLPSMNPVQGQVQGSKLLIFCPKFWKQRLQAKDGQRLLQAAAQEYFQDYLELELVQVNNGCQTQDMSQKQGQDLEEKICQEPAVQLVLQEFEGRILEVRTKSKENTGRQGQ